MKQGRKNFRDLIELEWVIFPKGWRIALEFERRPYCDEGQNAWMLYLAIPFILQFWFQLNGFSKFLMPKDGLEQEQTGFNWSGNHFSLYFMHCDDSWNTSLKKKKGLYFSFFVDDLIKGRCQTSSYILEEGEVLIPMVEKSYTANYRISEDIWSYPRWKSKKIKRMHLTMQDMIPHKGKGESDWDCGDDGFCGMTCPAETIEDGVAEVVKSMLKTRKNYGCVDSDHKHILYSKKYKNKTLYKG